MKARFSIEKKVNIVTQLFETRKVRYTLSCQCQFKNVLATDKIRIDDD